MSFLQVLQDLTIFDPNHDDTPLLGTYAGGVVTDPSFSTNPAHARPHLKFVENAGGSSVNFADGSGEIAQVSIDVIDKRRTANDQGTGLFTWLAAAADGDTALVGARALLRQVKWDGVTMESVIDGVIYNVKLLTGTQFVTYRIIVRDIRERERKVRLFVGATSTCVFPLVGPADGYGWNTEWDNATQDYVDHGDPAMPPIAGLKARVEIFTYSPTADYLSFVFSDPNRPLGAAAIPASDFPLWEGRTDKLGAVWDLVGKVQPLDPSNTSLNPDAQYYAPGAIIDWSATGPNGPWKTISQPFVPAGLRGYTSILQTFHENWDQKRPLIPHQIVIMRPSDVSLRPVHGADVWVRIRSNRAPSNDVPLFLERPFGDLLAAIYNGGYSYAGLGMTMRYSAPAMAAFKKATGKALVKITAPVDDARPWIQENIYRANGYAPAIRDGVVYPVSGDLPDATVTLPLLDDSVIYPGEADWEHGSGLIVNHGEFTYERDLVPSDYSKTGTVLTQSVTVQRDNGTSEARHNSKPITFEPVTVRAVYGYDVRQGTPNPDVSHEDAARRALARITNAIRRFANGAQQASATCRASLTESIYVGDWVILGASWMPDYVTRRRGINRLMQVVNIDKPAPHKRRFTLVDAGPYGQPIALPSAVSIAENADHSLTITVAGVPTTGGKNPRAEVQLAYGEAVPATASGEWKTVGFLAANGGVYVANHPSGRLAWARARGVADGARPSVWRVSASLRMSTLPGLRQARLTVNPYDAGTNPGYAHVEWSALASAAGVRVYYEKFANGAAEPDALTNHIDFDATALAGDLVLLNQWEQIVVQLEPWSGFGAGVVSGVQGPLTSRQPAQRRDTPYVTPTVTVDIARSGGNGTVTLTPVDPELQITEYWFRHRAGNSGSWTAFAQDSVAPYADTVGLVLGEGSAIEYKVVAYDPNGVQRVVAQEVVDLALIQTGPSLVVQPVPGVSRTDPYTVNYSGTGTITYDPGSGVFTTPPASGFTVSRDPTVDKVLIFKAVGAGQTVTDSITIPSQESDTVTPDLNVAVGTPANTTQPYTVTFSNPSGGTAPTGTARVFGSASMVIGGVTYVPADGAISISSGTVVTANRPASTTGPQAHITFRASIAGGGVEEIDRTIPAILNLGPTLSVKPTPGELRWTITYTGTGTITYAVDGGAYTTPPASPFSVDLDATSHAYVFKASLDGQDVPDTVIIPPKKPSAADPSITSVTGTPTFTPCLGGTVGGTMDISWVTANMPGGETYNVSVYVDGGTDGPSGPYNFTGVTSGSSFSVGLCPDSYGRITVEARSGGSTIATGNGTF